MYKKYEFRFIYQQVHNFCSETLGAFYLDIIKDRQYTTKTDGLPRRSAQTALYHISEAFVRWIAPILSFTAEEIWQSLPKVSTEQSVFFEQWYPLPEFSTHAKVDNETWDLFAQLRFASSKELEKLRNEKTIGSSLDSEIHLYCDQNLYDALQPFADELRFILICSYVHLHLDDDLPANAIKTDIDGLSLTAKASEHTKCVRCWHHREDVGSKAEHPELCGRCVENIDESGTGEQRTYA